jgi:hypothetical protein
LTGDSFEYTYLHQTSKTFLNYFEVFKHNQLIHPDDCDMDCNSTLEDFKVYCGIIADTTEMEKNEDTIIESLDLEAINELSNNVLPLYNYNKEELLSLLYFLKSQLRRIYPGKNQRNNMSLLNGIIQGFYKAFKEMDRKGWESVYKESRLFDKTIIRGYYFSDTQKAKIKGIFTRLNELFYTNIELLRNYKTLQAFKIYINIHISPILDNTMNSLATETTTNDHIEGLKEFSIMREELENNNEIFLVETDIDFGKNIIKINNILKEDDNEIIKTILKHISRAIQDLKVNDIKNGCTQLRENANENISNYLQVFQERVQMILVKINKLKRDVIIKKTDEYFDNKPNFIKKDITDYLETLNLIGVEKLGLNKDEQSFLGNIIQANSNLWIRVAFNPNFEKVENILNYNLKLLNEKLIYLRDVNLEHDFSVSYNSIIGMVKSSGKDKIIELLEKTSSHFQLLKNYISGTLPLDDGNYQTLLKKYNINAERNFPEYRDKLCDLILEAVEQLSSFYNASLYFKDREIKIKNIEKFVYGKSIDKESTTFGGKLLE